MNKKKGVYSKVIIAIVILLNTLFSIGVLYVFLNTSSEPSTLVVSWFAFTTGELFMLSTIKKSKNKKDED